MAPFPAMFGDLESARAAFGLGSVSFRCNVCGCVHRSTSRRVRHCLYRLSVETRLAWSTETHAAAKRLWARYRRLLAPRGGGSLSPPFFCFNTAAWTKLVSTLSLVVFRSVRRESWPLAQELATLSVPRELRNALRAAWRAETTRALDAWVREYDAAHLDEIRRLRESFRDLCTPRCFPPVSALGRKESLSDRIESRIESVWFARAGEVDEKYPARNVVSLFLGLAGGKWRKVLRDMLGAGRWTRGLLAFSTTLWRARAVVVFAPRARRSGGHREARLLFEWRAGRAAPVCLGPVSDGLEVSAAANSL